MRCPRGFRALAIGLLPLANAQGASPDLAIHYEAGGTNQVVLNWATVPGKSYFLLSTPSLRSPSWMALNPHPMTVATNVAAYRDSNVFSPKFYRVVELNPAVQVASVGISAQYWQASDVWVPATQSTTVTGSKTLIGLGAWWFGNYMTAFPPTDTNGLFASAIGHPQVGYSLEVQVSYQSSVAAGGHMVTPPEIGTSGDGFFLLIQAQDLAATSPVRDSGYTLNWHDYYGHNDPRTIQTITAATEGSAAKIGDLAIAIFVMDCENNANIQISLPSGWTSLGFNNDVVDNIGYRACYKIVSSPGTQSANCTWTDDSTCIAAAAITVFKSSGNP